MILEPPSDQKEHWHLDKKVPISIIVALLLYGVSGLWVIADIKKDVEVIKAQLLYQRDRDTAQDLARDSLLTLLRNQLANIELKLDRIIEGDRVERNGRGK